MGRHENVKSKLVDVDLEVASDDPKRLSIAFTDGVTMDVYKGRKQLKWFWLPRSEIEVTPSESGDKAVSVAMPEWLALKNGLI